MGLARARGAAPVLMLTWGWLTGCNPHKDVYLTYLAMQARPHVHDEHDTRLRSCMEKGSALAWVRGSV